MDAGAVARIFHGVLYQVAENRIDEIVVAADADRLEIVLHLDTVASDSVGKLLEDLLEHHLDVDRNHLELLGGLLELGDGGDVGDHVRKAQRLEVGALDEEPPALLAELRMVDYGLKVALYAADRSLQLVGDVACHLMLEAPGLDVGPLLLLASVALGEEIQYEEGEHEQQEFEKQEHPVGAEEILQADVEVLGDPDDTAVVLHCVVEITLAGGVGAAERCALTAAQAFLDFRAAEVVLHRLEAVVRIEAHLSVGVDQGHPDVVGEIGDRRIRLVAGLRHHLGVA